jgi:hypothetical protein
MRLILLCLPLALAACVSSPPAPDAPDAYRAESFQPPPRGAILTLLPPQETQYDEMREGAELLHKQLQKQLLAAGYQVIALKKDDYVRRWQQEAEAVGGVYQPDSGEFKGQEYLQALGNLLRTSCAITQCAMLMDARLVVRPAAVINGKVAWDGRTLPSNEPPSSDGSSPARTYAISIELSAIQPDGSLAFKSYGGTTLPQQYSLAEMQNYKNKPMPWNDGDLTAGLRIALNPLLSKPSAPSTPSVTPAAAPVK